MAEKLKIYSSYPNHHLFNCITGSLNRSFCKKLKSICTFAWEGRDRKTLNFHYSPMKKVFPFQMHNKQDSMQTGFS